MARVYHSLCYLPIKMREINEKNHQNIKQKQKTNEDHEWSKMMASSFKINKKQKNERK